MSTKSKKVKMSKSVIVNASANDLWQIVGPQFADASKWSTAVDHSAGHGKGKFEGASCDTRSCDLSAKGFSSVNERITEYDDSKRTLAFDVFEGMPGFVTYANNRTVITDLGQGKSKAELQITMHMKPLLGFFLGGMLHKNLGVLIDSALDDLKVFAETGKPSLQKQERMKKLAVMAA